MPLSGRKSSKTKLVVGLLILAWANASAIADDFAEEIERFRAFAKQQMSLDQIPGMTIGFMHGETTWVGGFGYADLENGTPAKVESAYRLASVTKPMTAIGILTLVEQGKIDLDAEVQTYVPYFPRKKYPVTVRLLLGHLGGISHYRNYDAEGHFKDHKATREAIAVFEDFELVAEPGTEFNYSSYGYNLLGAVIEGASGQSYGDFMQEHLWGPLEMDDTRMDDPNAIIPNRVRGYRWGPNRKIINSEFVDISSRFAAGGTRSTVPDLLKFAKGLSQGRVLSPQSLDLMWRPMVQRDGESTGYGMGWGIEPVNGRFRVSHSGGQAETRTYFAYYPNDDLTIAVASNFEGANRQPYIDYLYRLIMKEAWGQRIYAADADADASLRAARFAFNEGVMHWDRYQRAATTDPKVVEEAFRLFNTHVENAFPEAELGLERPADTNPMVVLGSHMASTLASAHGEAFGDAVHQRGMAAFFADYVDHYQRDAEVGEALRFTASFEAQAKQWAADWQRVWQDDTRLLAVTHTKDVGALTNRLLESFSEASIYPDYSEQFTDLVETRFMSADVTGAVEAARCATQLYPRGDVAHVLGGIGHLALGDTQEARTWIRRALALNPEGAASSRGLNNRAYQLKGVGQTQLGLQVLDIARELHPEDANLYDSTGEFYLALGDQERSIKYYEKAVALDPEFENPRLMLERIRLEMQPNQVILEFRIAEDEPAPGLTEMVFDPTGESFYLHDAVLVNHSDVDSAFVIMREGRPAVELVLTSSGTQKFGELTEHNVGKRCCMILNDQLVSAPRIMAPIRKGRAIVAGDFTEAEARHIAQALSRPQP